ncbi:MAG: discoidin domain-containing protein, partial [Clostridia bacterium]|nr:discoidin domain-containing protein [Clostridia bacterium]
MKKTLASLLIVVMVFCMLGTMFVTAEDESLTWEDTLGYADNGNAYVEVPYGYTWYIDDVNGTIGGEDATICTTQDAYNACNPNWAITIYAAKQADGTYVAQKDAIVTPGSAAGAGITIGEGQIAIVVHSSSSNPDSGYANWQAKVVAMSVKAGDIFEVAEDFSTVTAIGPGGTVEPEEPVIPDAPNTGDDDPEVPSSGNLALGKDVANAENVDANVSTLWINTDLTDGVAQPDWALDWVAGEWHGYWWNAESASAYEWTNAPDGVATPTVDLGAVYPVGLVRVNMFLGSDMGIVPARSVTVKVSTDGENWTEVAVKELAIPEAGDTTVGWVELALDAHVDARYVRVEMVLGAVWLFVDEIEVYSETELPEEPVEPEEPETDLPEGALEFQLSHVNYYSWGTYFDMVAYGEGRNCHNLGNGDYGCEWWIAIKVDNVDGVYTVTQIEGNGDAKAMTASADGFIMYLFSGNENYPANFAAAQQVEVGYIVYSHTFDWTTDVTSETALGNIVFVPAGTELPPVDEPVDPEVPENNKVEINVNDNAILTDGNTGFAGAWGEVGTGHVVLVNNGSCQTVGMDATLYYALGETKKLDGVTVDLYHCANVMIGYPEGQATVLVSVDGENWTEVGKYDLATADVAVGNSGTVSNTFSFDAVEAAYVKVLLYAGSNEAVLGTEPSDGKIFWEFISVAEFAVSECDPVFITEGNAAAGKDWTGDTDALSNYQGDVTDGVCDPDGKYDTSLWLGFDGRKLDDGVATMILDLDFLYSNIIDVNIHAWPAGYSGISIPDAITVYASEDGENYAQIGYVDAFESTDPQWINFTFEEAVTARYIKIDYAFAGTFLFVSEVEVMVGEKSTEPDEPDVPVVKETIAIDGKLDDNGYDKAVWFSDGIWQSVNGATLADLDVSYTVRSDDDNIYLTIKVNQGVDFEKALDLNAWDQSGATNFRIWLLGDGMETRTFYDLLWDGEAFVPFRQKSATDELTFAAGIGDDYINMEIAIAKSSLNITDSFKLMVTYSTPHCLKDDGTTAYNAFHMTACEAMPSGWSGNADAYQSYNCADIALGTKVPSTEPDEPEVPENEIEINVNNEGVLTDGNTGFAGNWGEVGTNDVLLIQNGNCQTAGLNVTLNYALDETKKLDGVIVDLYHCAGVMIGYPEGQATVLVSVDGENWTEVGKYDLAAADVALGNYGTVSSTFSFDAVEAAYVKVVLYAGSSTGVLGDSPADNKIFWEFISVAEFAVSEAADVPPVEEEKHEIIVSHVNAYTWGAYNEMVIVGEGQNSMSKLGYDCTWWIALKVENVDGIYTVTAIEGNGVAKEMTAPADGFLLYCYSNDAASFEAAGLVEVGDVLLSCNFDWKKDAASATPIGSMVFGPQPSADHDHTYTSTIVTAPTLSAEGEALYICVCGDRYTEAVPPVKAQPDELATLPENALTLDYAGYIHDAFHCIIAGDNLTINDLTALGNDGVGKDMNYFYIIVVDANGKVVDTWFELGRPNAVKSDVVCPAGGYIIGYNGNKEDSTALTNIAIGSTITLHNVDLNAIRGVAGHAALTNAGFTVVRPETDVEVNVNENGILTDGNSGFAGNWGEVGANDVLLVSNPYCTEVGMNVTLQYALGELKKIDTVILDLYHCAGVMIGYPEGTATIMVSTDGENYVSVGSFNLAGADVALGNYGTVSSTFKFNTVEAAYVKVVLFAGSNEAVLGTEPADGKKFWEFIAVAEFAVAEAPENLAAGLEWTGDTECGSDYKGNITDGTIITWGAYDTSIWYGFDQRKTDDSVGTIILDLGAVYSNLDQIRAHVWPAGHSGIAVPQSYDFYISEDGENYTLLTSVAGVAGDPMWIGTDNTETFTARYVKLDIVGTSSDTFWFLDELEVNAFDAQLVEDLENAQVEINVNDNAILTDGNTGFAGNWGEVGTGDVLLIQNGNCQNVGMDVTLYYALGETKTIDGVTIDLYHCAGVMIGYPEGQATVLVSLDGESWTEIGKYDLATADVALGNYGTVSSTFTFDAVEAAYVKVLLYAGSNEAVLGTEPADGKKFWEFISVAEFAVSEVVSENGTIEAPYTELPADLTVPAGTTVFFTLPAGALQLTVSGNDAVAITNAMGMAIAYAENGVASLVFDYVELGETVLFGIMNQNPYVDAYVTATIGEPVIPEEGSENNPINANDKYFEGAMCYLLNPTLSAGDTDGIWYEFTAPADGILCVENSGSNYQLSVLQGYSQLNAIDDGVYSNPVMSYRVTAGETVKIWIIAEPDENWNYPETTVYASIFFVAGNEDEPVSIKSKESFKANIAAGDTVFFKDATNGGLWAGKGLVISGYADAIACMTVVVNGTEYTDTDGDGVIEISMPGDYGTNMNPSFSITNGHEWDLPFTLTLVDEAAEDREGCSCGAELEHFDAVEPGCHQTGMNEYWYCADCDVYYADEAATIVTNRLSLTIPALNELVYVEGYEAVCHQTGMNEYWYCPECDAVFADAAGIQLTNRKNLVIPAPVELTYVAALEATCHQNGNTEYWYCADCGAMFADAMGAMITNIKNVTVPALKSLTHVEGYEATCHQTGLNEYWYCEDCDAVFADAAGTMLTNRLSLTIPGKELTYVPAAEAVCHQNGHSEYWTCEDCGAIFTDAAGRYVTNIKNITIPGKALTYVPAVEATCHQNGCAEYWYCEECDAVFADAAGTQLTNRKNLTIVADNELVYVPEVPATCHQNGTYEYWYCPECDAVFADAAGIQLTNRKNLTIVANALTYVPAVEATCHQNGCAEYWYCEECDAVFADEAGTQLTNRKNLTIVADNALVYVPEVPATCHQNGTHEYWYCPECDAVFADAAGIQLT